MDFALWNQLNFYFAKGIFDLLKHMSIIFQLYAVHDLLARKSVVSSNRYT